jgi:hypothetical protein
MVGGLLIDDPRLRFPAYLAWLAVATAGWIGLAPPRGRWGAVLLLCLGTSLRVAYLSASPAFSEDVFRHVYEGRVIWEKGPAFPYVVPPADAPRHDVSERLRDEAWLRINHPDLPTIYPPLAQAVFAVAAGVADKIGWSPLQTIKTTLVLAEAAACGLLVRLGMVGAATIMWMCPLLILETAREGHGDALAVLGYAVAIAGWTRHRARWGHGGFALAAATKLHGLLGLAIGAAAHRRGLLWAGLIVSSIGWPWLLGGTEAGTSLSAYAARWQAGEGAFGLVLAGVRWAMGGDWVRWLGITLTAQQGARVLMGGGFVVALVWTAVRRPPSANDVPLRAGRWLLVLLLLSPTVHPWYAQWLLPFAVLEHQRQPGSAWGRAMGVFCALSPVLHHPGWLELLTGRWQEWWLPRVILHGATWLAIGVGPRFRKPSHNHASH